MVITGLNNYVRPFVCYPIGDLAYATDTREPCACGRAILAWFALIDLIARG